MPLIVGLLLEAPAAANCRFRFKRMASNGSPEGNSDVPAGAAGFVAAFGMGWKDIRKEDGKMVAEDRPVVMAV